MREAIDDKKIVFVRNPDGGVHDVLDTHPCVEKARNRRDGWRLATAVEIRAAARDMKIDPKPYLGQVEED